MHHHARRVTLNHFPFTLNIHRSWFLYNPNLAQALDLPVPPADANRPKSFIVTTEKHYHHFAPQPLPSTSHPALTLPNAFFQTLTPTPIPTANPSSFPPPTLSLGTSGASAASISTPSPSPLSLPLPLAAPPTQLPAPHPLLEHALALPPAATAPSCATPIKQLLTLSLSSLTPFPIPTPSLPPPSESQTLPSQQSLLPPWNPTPAAPSAIPKTSLTCPAPGLSAEFCASIRLQSLSKSGTQRKTCSGRFELSALRCESQASKREGSRAWKEASGRGFALAAAVRGGLLPLEGAMVTLEEEEQWERNLTKSVVLPRRRKVRRSR